MPVVVETEVPGPEPLPELVLHFVTAGLLVVLVDVLDLVVVGVVVVVVEDIHPAEVAPVHSVFVALAVQVGVRVVVQVQVQARVVHVVAVVHVLVGGERVPVDVVVFNVHGAVAVDGAPQSAVSSIFSEFILVSIKFFFIEFELLKA